MSLELYIWGPAFGLPSIDPECLAAVAYLTLAVPRDTWSVVATSPSAVPHILPALRDAQSDRWLAAGFDAVVACLRSPATATLHHTFDLDAGLSPASAADVAAYAALVRTDAAPLLAALLYVSSANWTAATRPALSRLLPFPLAWLEPPALRTAHTASAAHLGLAHLDTDTVEELASGGAPTRLTAALQTVPDRLRSKLGTAASTSSLSASALAQARLDAAACSCFNVLATRLLRTRDACGTASTTSLDCLAFGYLALMVVPAVPQPFLRDAMRRYQPGLAVFVADIAQALRTARSDLWSPEPTRLTTAAPTVRYYHSLWLRTLHGTIHCVPGLGNECLVWLWRQLWLGQDEVVVDEEEEEDLRPWRRDVLRARRRRLGVLVTSAAGAALIFGMVVGYRAVSPFGAPVMTYRRARQMLVGLGAAGAMLDLL